MGASGAEARSEEEGRAKRLCVRWAPSLGMGVRHHLHLSRGCWYQASLCLTELMMAFDNKRTRVSHCHGRRPGCCNCHGQWVGQQLNHFVYWELGGGQHVQTQSPCHVILGPVACCSCGSTPVARLQAAAHGCTRPRRPELAGGLWYCLFLLSISFGW